jgi:hypothetical protein
MRTSSGCDPEEVLINNEASSAPWRSVASYSAQLRTMKAREVRLMVTLGVLAALMLAPMLVLGHKLQGAGGDPAYKALVAVGASLDGNRDADAAAAEALKTVQEADLDGHEVLVKRAPDGTCWYLDMSTSPKPKAGESSLCP